MKNLGRLLEPLDLVTKEYVDHLGAKKQNNLTIVTLFLGSAWTRVGGSDLYTQEVAMDGATAGTVAELFMDAAVLGRMAADNVKYLWTQGGTGKITFYAKGAPFSESFYLNALVYDAVNAAMERQQNAAGGNTVLIDGGTASYAPNAAGGNTVEIGA